MPPASKLNFFDHNPPPEELVDALFCNRVRELKQGLTMLDGAAASNEILAVYGPTRSGKSHYVRRLLHALRERDQRSERARWRTISVNANNRGSVRAVLEDLFVEVWKALVGLDPTIAEEERGNWDAFRNHLERVRALVLGEVAETSSETQQGSTTTADGGVELKGPLASARLGGKVETREQESERQVRRAPTDREVTGHIRDALDALQQYDPGRLTLLFVDDLDLLDRRGREGAEVSALLVDQLKSLADCQKCLVMVTIRELYFNGREKDFNDFVPLGFLGVDDLRAVYAQHVKVFNEGRDVFSPEVLGLLVQGADGRVGIFLKTCRELWRYHIDAEEPIARAGLAEFLQAQLKRFKDDAVKHLIPEVERVLAGLAIQVEIKDDLQETPLLYSVLLPIPGQPGRYTVNPMWLDVLGCYPAR
jgi:hypothetical protein